MLRSLRVLLLMKGAYSTVAWHAVKTSNVVCEPLAGAEGTLYRAAEGERGPLSVPASVPPICRDPPAIAT